MKQIISASRRTDIPAHYLDHLISCIHQGFAEVTNPYSGRKTVVDLKPENVHTIVLWSKNFEHFLCKNNFFDDYNLYFLFTINDLPYLEPSLPSLTKRLIQVGKLTDFYDPERVAWRFDPIVFDHNGPVSTINSYISIGKEIARFGVRRSIFSFMDMYGKVKARNSKFRLNLIDPPRQTKIQYASELAQAAADIGLSLESCSEDIGKIDGIKPAACIDGGLLSGLTGESAPLAKDKGQRLHCNCTVSRDIGSYRDMPCPHGCLYCYANPQIAVTEGDDRCSG
ncbi:MAG: DUF1848 family protein [Candidatus Latescibacteria bacterium]|nr:DUF1848 family protein [Candidatus Latescibacterota bacterium]